MDKHCRVLLTPYQKTNKMDCQALRHSVDSFLENMVEYEVGYLKILAGVFQCVKAVTHASWPLG